MFFKSPAVPPPGDKQPKIEHNSSILQLQSLPALPPSVPESPPGESQLNASPFSCSSWDIPRVPASRAARAMPRKELGMAGCNSGSCDSMASTASNHSQRVSNPGLPSPTHPSELRKGLGQISAQILSPSVLWRQLEALRQQQDPVNSCPKALPAFPSCHVCAAVRSSGCCKGCSGAGQEPWRWDPLPGDGIHSLERLLCCQGCRAQSSRVPGSRWLRAGWLHLEVTAS